MAEKPKAFLVYMTAAELARLDAHVAETSPGRENRSEAIRRAVKEMIDRHERAKRRKPKP